MDKLQGERSKAEGRADHGRLEIGQALNFPAGQELKVNNHAQVVKEALTVQITEVYPHGIGCKVVAGSLTSTSFDALKNWSMFVIDKTSVNSKSIDVSDGVQNRRLEKERKFLLLGKKEEVTWASELVPLSVDASRPDARKPGTLIPDVGSGKSIICGLERLGEELYLARDIEEMQALHERYSIGLATDIHWYTIENASLPE